MQRKVDSPAEYLAAVPEKQLPMVEHLRALIKEAAPGAREEIRYGMLSYEDEGGLFGLAAQKHYVGLYVLATQAMREMAAELGSLDHGKGCIRFKRLETIPTPIIKKLLRLAMESGERDCE
jgi:uncharacterized protein YdhG (YjbR/CyaY superfamily)